MAFLSVGNLFIHIKFIDWTIINGKIVMFTSKWWWRWRCWCWWCNITFYEIRCSYGTVTTGVLIFPKSSHTHTYACTHRHTFLLHVPYICIVWVLVFIFAPSFDNWFISSCLYYKCLIVFNNATTTVAAYKACCSQIPSRFGYPISWFSLNPTFFPFLALFWESTCASYNWIDNSRFADFIHYIVYTCVYTCIQLDGLIENW